MLGYRKRAFARAHSLLRSLQTNQDDFVALKQLQVLLIQEIMRAEARIRELKDELKSLDAASEQRRLRALSDRIEKVRDVMFIWKSFGDGIAFTYLGKFALKQTFYRTDRYLEKQSAGFISGKEGLANELGLLLEALKHNVPAVLTDLTNTIRYGDICLLGASDPVLWEVKSSKSGGGRSRRQKASLDELNDFLKTDRADNFRGMPNVRRQAIDLPERDYTEQLNECISRAMSDGLAISEPEPGLQYIATRTKDADPERMLSSMRVENPWIFSLNERRIARSWAPYFPFTLSIRRIDNLWAFARGEVYILVVVGISYLESIVAEAGFLGTFDRDDDLFPLKVDMGSAGVGRLSADLLSRIAYECVSPKSLIVACVESYKQASESLKQDADSFSAPKYRDPKMAKLAEKYASEAKVNFLVVPNSAGEASDAEQN